MQSFAQRPWLAVSLGIVGLILGYTIAMAPSTDFAFGAYTCPCQNGECANNNA